MVSQSGNAGSALSGNIPINALFKVIDSSIIHTIDDIKSSKRNEIKEIKNFKQLEKVDLDYDTPRIKLAMQNLGLSKDECLKR